MLEGSDKSRTQPSDVLIPLANWSLGRSAALCLTFTSLLNTDIFSKVSVTAVSAA